MHVKNLAKSWHILGTQKLLIPLSYRFYGVKDKYSILTICVCLSLSVFSWLSPICEHLVACLTESSSSLPLWELKLYLALRQKLCEDEDYGFFPLKDVVVLISLSGGNYLNVSIFSSANLILVVAAMSATLRRILQSLERVLWSSATTAQS